MGVTHLGDYYSSTDTLPFVSRYIRLAGSCRQDPPVPLQRKQATRDTFGPDAER